MKNKPYPKNICMPCGEKHGHRGPALAHWHPGKCEVCDNPDAMVTDPCFFGELKMDWRVREAAR